MRKILIGLLATCSLFAIAFSARADDSGGGGIDKGLYGKCIGAIDDQCPSTRIQDITADFEKKQCREASRIRPVPIAYYNGKLVLAAQDPQFPDHLMTPPEAACSLCRRDLGATRTNSLSTSADTTNSGLVCAVSPSNSVDICNASDDEVNGNLAVTVSFVPRTAFQWDKATRQPLFNPGVLTFCARDDVLPNDVCSEDNQCTVASGTIDCLRPTQVPNGVGCRELHKSGPTGYLNKCGGVAWMGCNTLGFSDVGVTDSTVDPLMDNDPNPSEGTTSPTGYGNKLGVY